MIKQEYTLEELKLPSADKILQGVKNIEKQVGLVGWREKNYISETYKGFGLTYNLLIHIFPYSYFSLFSSLVCLILY